MLVSRGGQDCGRKDSEAPAYAMVAVSEMSAQMGAPQMGAPLVETAMNPLLVLPQEQGLRAANGGDVRGK